MFCTFGPIVTQTIKKTISHGIEFDDSDGTTIFVFFKCSQTMSSNVKEGWRIWVKDVVAWEGDGAFEGVSDDVLESVL